MSSSDAGDMEQQQHCYGYHGLIPLPSNSSCSSQELKLGRGHESDVRIADVSWPWLEGGCTWHGDLWGPMNRGAWLAALTRVSQASEKSVFKSLVVKSW